MRMHRNTELGGYAFVTDGIWDLTASTIKAAETRTWYNYILKKDYWTGKGFKDWPDVMRELKTPDPAGLAEVNAMMDEFRTELRELPQTIKRKRMWNKSTGNVHVQRAIGGNPNFMYRFNRQKHTGPKNIILVHNADASGSMSSNGLKWRGIVTCCLADLLEDAGYLCEVWIVKAGTYTFTDTECPHSYVCAKIKDAGQALDLDLMNKVFSPWFLRVVLFGMRLACPPKVDRGDLAGVWFNYPEVWDTKYMDAGIGFLKFRIPMTYGKTAALAEARKVLKTITESNQSVEA